MPYKMTHKLSPWPLGPSSSLSLFFFLSHNLPNFLESLPNPQLLLKRYIIARPPPLIAMAGHQLTGWLIDGDGFDPSQPSCSVCIENYDENRLGVFLPSCGHSMCRYCVLHKFSQAFNAPADPSSLPKYV